ncbi:MAG: ABC transporter substrate-binding protein [Rhodospirillum sp.]|nr:ABC transporter substrate-binding protein [Rhodospirillum sp.]MCF8488178.1 ABC transporter substrate-binding protein [Rhodospirillum sp.]MCF8501935.1 ABC transporter substrate-binding protein [Rhodospirillum sp.]
MTTAVLVVGAFLVGGASSRAAEDWDQVLAAARGRTVTFNAWGGDEKVNAYIAWVGERVARDHGVTLRHVKVGDIAEVVSRILAEKSAGRDSGGGTDLMWVNGENFLALKENGLLYGPFLERLPNAALLDLTGVPTLTTDFTVPTEGLESPWGMAQFVFMVDTARVPNPPRTLTALADWIQAHPGRFTYPAPPDFTGSTFLKQALHDLTPDPSILQSPATDANFTEGTAPLWRWLDRIHPFLWRKGEAFPASAPALRQMLDDAAVDFAMTFRTGEASSAIAQGLLPDTVRTFVLEGGTIGNTHFVAIPFNAADKEGAMVVANFLLSAEAQLRKQDPAHWGDDTVLAMGRLDPEERSRFDSLPLGEATLSSDARGVPLPEPHPSWMSRIEGEWLRRFGH